MRLPIGNPNSRGRGGKINPIPSEMDFNQGIKLCLIYKPKLIIQGFILCQFFCGSNSTDNQSSCILKGKWRKHIPAIIV